MERQKMEILQQPQQQVITSAKRTYVLCHFNFGALASTKNCSQCSYFSGLVTYPDNIILPRIMCLGSGHPKMLELYTHCSKHRRSVRCEKFCKKCLFESFNGIETSTAHVKCNMSSKESTVSILPQKTSKIDWYPYPIPCPQGQTVDINLCLQKCHYFKGIYGTSVKGKVCCFYPKAVESEYLTCRKYKKYLTCKKRVCSKSLWLPNLSWLFDEKIKTTSIGLKVDCILDKSLIHCRECVDHSGVRSNFRVNCKIFLHNTAIYIPNCPRVKGSVLLGVCSKCQSFVEIYNDRVRCSWTKLQNYVTREPKKVKFYYDFGD
jgi:hypothetical protein